MGLSFIFTNILYNVPFGRNRMGEMVLGNYMYITERKNGNIIIIKRKVVWAIMMYIITIIVIMN